MGKENVAHDFETELLDFKQEEAET